MQQYHFKRTRFLKFKFLMAAERKKSEERKMEGFEYHRTIAMVWIRARNFWASSFNRL